MKPLTLDFYQREDVLRISKDLLGKFLFTSIDGCLTGGKIVETEAYKGIEDKACHAFGGKRTKRNEAMYKAGGVAYTYICYGMHVLLNVVTNKEEIPHAVLIRGIEPLIGIEKMLERRKKIEQDKALALGPANLTVALGIDMSLNGISFMTDRIWIEDGSPPEVIHTSPRIGVQYAEEHALLPWRFYLK